MNKKNRWMIIQTVGLGIVYIAIPFFSIYQNLIKLKGNEDERD